MDGRLKFAARRIGQIEEVERLFFSALRNMPWRMGRERLPATVQNLTLFQGAISVSARKHRVAWAAGMFRSRDRE
jgi:hypothetical protein